MPPGDVAERHGRADVDPARRVVAAHHVRLVAAGRVQPGDRLSRRRSSTRDVGVGAQPEEGAEAAGQHPDRVERPLLQRRQRRVRAVLRVAGRPVERRAAAAELRVLADPGVLVELRDGRVPARPGRCRTRRPVRPASCRASGSRTAGTGQAGTGNGLDMPNGYRRWKAWSQISQACDLLARRARRRSCRW